MLEYSNNIKEAAKTLMALINEILDFSKIEAGKMEIITAEYNLASLLNDLITMIEFRAKEKKLELEVDVDRNLPANLIGDEIRVKEVITNILTNAVKYTQEGKIILQVGFQPVADETDMLQLIVAVEDTGIGIREEELSRIYESFQRADEERNRFIEGTGLGISITVQLLKLMGGELKVKSIYGKGSTFTVIIPQKIKGEEKMEEFNRIYESARQQADRNTTTFTAPEAKVLVVDDNKMNLTVAEGLLKHNGIKVDKALSGRQCLEMIQERQYDIIFMDHMMPGMDGIETLQRMQKKSNHKCANTVVIALTANAIVGAKEEYLKSGFDGYLSKPIEYQKLENIMIKHLPENLLVWQNGKEKKSITRMILEIEGLNQQAGIEKCGGEELFVRVLHEFSATSEYKMGKLAGYWQERDLEAYVIAVHALKSSAKIIGAEKLGALAEQMESWGRQGEWEPILLQHEELLTLYRGIVAGINRALPRHDNNQNKTKELTESELRAELTSLQEAVEAFDVDQADEIVSRLDEVRWTDETSGRFDKIKELIVNVDMEAAEGIIAEWREEIGHGK